MSETTSPSRPAWPPSRDELARLVAQHGELGAARIYGVSRSTLRYQCAKLGVRSPHPPGTSLTLRRGRGQAASSAAEATQPDLPAAEAERLLALLRREPVTLEALADRLDRGPGTVRRWLDALRAAGYQVTEREGRWLLSGSPPAPADTQTHLEPARGIVRFAVVADTHIGSRFSRLSALADFYRRLADEGIGEVFHVGDLLDGHGMYRGQEWEQDVHGFDAQIQYAVEHYPRIAGIRTRLIAGNHDLSYLKVTGADPLVRVAQLRDDIEYLGPYSAWVNVTARFRAYLVHPNGGPAYARSYKLQKLIESFQGGRKPNLLIAGHWHEWVVLWERNVWAMMAGCWQDQTDYMRRKALQPKVGGTIVTVRLDQDGAIQSFEPRFVAYLVPEAVDEEAKAA